MRAHALSGLGLLLAAVTMPAQAADIVIQVNDPAGQGFNDASPRAPLPTNPGTTLGQQRLNVFQFAAARWGERLQSAVTILLRADWQGFNSLSCSSSSGTLGFAGPFTFLADFPGAPIGNTFYPSALADALTGGDRNPGNPDILASFNPFVDSDPNCLGGAGFYYGTDHVTGGKIDLLNVVMHEIAHGLGFTTTTDGSTGEPILGLFSVYDHFLFDESSDLFWPQMNNSQRSASARGNGSLVWNSPLMHRGGLSLTAGLNADNDHVRMHDPSTFASGSSVAHFSTAASPNLLMEPALTGSLRAGRKVDLSTCLLNDIGWPLLPPFGCPDLLSDLQLQISASAGSVEVGQAVIYTYTVTNNGPDRATNVALSAASTGAAATLNSVGSSQGGCTALPCDLGTLDSGVSATITVTVTAETAGQIGHAGSVDPDQLDPVPGDNLASTTTTVNVGADTTPDSFTFTDLKKRKAGTTQTSETRSISGIDTAVAATLSGDASARLLINGALAPSGSLVEAGDTIALQLTAPAAGGATATAQLTIGTYSTAWSITTRIDATPNAFTFTDLVDRPSGSVNASEAVRIRSINVPVAASISGDSSAQLVVNKTVVPSGTMIEAGSRLWLRLTAPAVGGSTASATVTVGNYSTSWNVTADIDQTPDAFTFPNATAAAAGKRVTSKARTVAGINVPVTASLSGSPDAVLIVNGAAVSPPVSVSAGDAVRLRLRSPASGQTVSATLTVGTYSTAWSVSTP